MVVAHSGWSRYALAGYYGKPEDLNNQLVPKTLWGYELRNVGAINFQVDLQVAVESADDFNLVQPSFKLGRSLTYRVNDRVFTDRKNVYMYYKYRPSYEAGANPVQQNERNSMQPSLKKPKPAVLLDWAAWKAYVESKKSFTPEEETDTFLFFQYLLVQPKLANTQCRSNPYSEIQVVNFNFDGMKYHVGENDEEGTGFYKPPKKNIEWNDFTQTPWQRFKEKFKKNPEPIRKFENQQHVIMKWFRVGCSKNQNKPLSEKLEPLYICCTGGVTKDGEQMGEAFAGYVKVRNACQQMRIFVAKQQRQDLKIISMRNANHQIGYFKPVCKFIRKALDMEAGEDVEAAEEAQEDLNA